jgi:hypothetical protein
MSPSDVSAVRSRNLVSPCTGLHRVHAGLPDTPRTHQRGVATSYMDIARPVVTADDTRDATITTVDRPDTRTRDHPTDGHHDRRCRGRPDLHVRIRQQDRSPATGRAGLGRTPRGTVGGPVHPRTAPQHATPGPARRNLRSTPTSTTTLDLRSLVTLALNVADPIVTGAYGRAAFDAVARCC